VPESPSLARFWLFSPFPDRAKRIPALKSHLGGHPEFGFFGSPPLVLVVLVLVATWVMPIRLEALYSPPLAGIRYGRGDIHIGRQGL